MEKTSVGRRGEGRNAAAPQPQWFCKTRLCERNIKRALAVRTAGIYRDKPAPVDDTTPSV
jgi:hypothetical protein